MNTMRGLFATVKTPDGLGHVLNMTGATIPCTITAYPVAGDTLTVEQSADGGVTWDPTLVLNTNVLANQVLGSGCTHIRVTRSAGAGTTSYVTVC